MSNNPQVECMQSIMNSTPKNSAEHDELAHSQQRASQLQYSPLYNNCFSGQAADSATPLFPLRYYKRKGYLTR